ncbi:helix-turn-helix transcriptional regulator [Amycolatopsis sp. NPDC005961]|uniref:helix-turn-helix domain-containing protein n=1 Tax=Amycolatopsis sp. NPDC005961 TaxID=3156720 RepID=UPI0033E7B5DF
MATPVATPRSRALGFGLRAARVARGLGLRELARLVDVAPQVLSHWESGTRVPRVEQVGLLLGAMRVEPVERGRLLELAEYAKEPNWLERTSFALGSYLEYERAASAMVNWEPHLVPGLLQTPEYAQVIFGSHGLPRQEVDRLTRIRLRRREVLTGRHRLSCSVLVGEEALRRTLGDPETMAGQLRHLVQAARLENISLRVVPSDSGYHPGLKGSFVLFDFAQLPPVVHIEHLRGNSHLYDREYVTDYREAATTMTSLALTELDSHRFIQTVLVELGR